MMSKETSIATRPPARSRLSRFTRKLLSIIGCVTLLVGASSSSRERSQADTEPPDAHNAAPSRPQESLLKTPLVVVDTSTIPDWLEPGDEAGVAALREDPTMLQDYTGDSGLVAAALERASRQTIPATLPVGRLGIALQKAAELTRGAHNLESRNVILVISDLPGRRASEEALPVQAPRSLAEAGCSLYWSNSEAVPPSPSELFGIATSNLTIREVLSLSGGEFINGKWSAFLDRLRIIYRIAYLADTRRARERVRIKLEVRPSPRWDPSDLKLVYPRFAIIPDAPHEIL